MFIVFNFSLKVLKMFFPNEPAVNSWDMKVECLDSHCHGLTWLLWGAQWFQTYRWGCSTRWPEDSRSQSSAPGPSCPLPSSGNLPTAETHSSSSSGTLSFTTSCRVGWLDVLNTGTAPWSAAALCTGQWLSGAAAGPSPNARKDREKRLFVNSDALGFFF